MIVGKCVDSLVNNDSLIEQLDQSGKIETKDHHRNSKSKTEQLLQHNVIDYNNKF